MGSFAFCSLVIVATQVQLPITIATIHWEPHGMLSPIVCVRARAASAYSLTMCYSPCRSSGMLRHMPKQIRPITQFRM